MLRIEFSPRWPRLPRPESRGVTLIIIAGVLSVMAALGAGFYSITIMSARSSTHYADGVRAELLARAGVADAIGRLRTQAYFSIESPNDPWYTVDYLHGGARQISFSSIDKTVSSAVPVRTSYSRAIANTIAPQSDRFTLNVTDAASKININACDNLGVLLDNLCRVIGPPLAAADLDALQPRRWAAEGSPAGMYATSTNKDDTSSNLDLYYRPPVSGTPMTGADGAALYGDGYAIARYRSLYGRFRDIADLKNAMTYVARAGFPLLEQLEREIKYTAIRDYLTIDSWVDTNTVCVGKFEWCRDARTLIDRDKSWIADDPTNDPDNHRGSLRGCYVSIVNGHGAGQLRRITTNGIDWIQVDHDFVVLPGPISSYMIIAKEDALVDSDGEPMTDANGNLIDDPKIDYKRFPLCIHRAPINVNTASDKVLAALFLGINVQHGTPLAVGTDASVTRAEGTWLYDDPLKLFGLIPTQAGLKRTPIDTGKPVLDRPEPWTDATNFGYIDNFKTLSLPNFLVAGGVCNEAHELAYRIISARQRRLDPATGLPTTAADPDPVTADPEAGFAGYERGPFRSWDDLYFRVVKPWDDIRSYNILPDPSLPGRTTIPNSAGLTRGLAKASLAPMIMAHFNSNTDLLKFNPNIEWIDRWGRNFTSMEPVMAFNGSQPAMASGLLAGPTPPGAVGGRFYFIRNMRYRVEEMIDKSDLNRSTTEFSLDSGGIFEIKSSGQVVKNGEMLAERKMEALVQVYDVWRESTQRQFVQGTISQAANQSSKWSTPIQGNFSGTVARDVTNNGGKRLALTTLPEPLVPLNYRFSNTSGGRLMECVDDQPRDARGNPKDPKLPDVLANKILPAIYDGQIVLGTNVCSFDPAAQDTFLASFNGDLDTDTCVGNGREQAKTPKNSRIRVCDTISLLGLLNDDEIDIDPDSYPVFALNVSVNGTGIGSPLGPLDKTNYGNNVSCRVGDLRAEGIYCGILGTACKDATLKYPIGDGPATLAKNGSGPAPKLTYQNYDPRNGATVGMWFKPLWHANDHLEHEFFSATSNGDSWMSRGNKICKNGYLQGGNGIGWPEPDGTLWALAEDFNDDDITICLHSGTDNVPTSNLPPNINTETPCFHTQPFRWSYVGAVFQYNKPGNGGEGDRGFWHSGTADPAVDSYARNVIRPFISTYRYPEGTAYKTDDMWGLISLIQLNGCDLDGQPAAYPWEANNNTRKYEGCFSINNVNEGGSPFLHIYRQQPTDTAYSVIDEMKISKRALSTTEIGDLMTTSRYYLPADPSDSSQQPTFTSQTLIQSLYGNAATGAQMVSPARVTWTVFTPRFMQEYKKPGTYTRSEVVHGSRVSVPFPGPFDYAQYNADIDYDHEMGWKSTSYNARNPYLGVNRVPQLNNATLPYKQPHYTKGVQIEVLNDNAPLKGFENSTGAFLNAPTFNDPDVINTFVDPKNPAIQTLVPSNKLRYRVHFVYPIYKEGDPKAPLTTVDPKTQFLLDTPVFDDISITYVTVPRVIYFHDLAE